MLSEEDSLVLVIDIQEKLVNALEKSSIVDSASKLVKAANILDIPVILTEQYPKGLGDTVLDIKENCSNDSLFFEKTYFNAILEEGLLEKIQSYGKKQIVIMGIETHICVYQTASALVEAGFEVYAVKDACASRKKYEFKQGIEAMKQNGVKISCVEIVLFEWLKGAKHPKFKEVQALIK